MFNRNDVKYGYELNGAMGSAVKNEEYFVSDYIKVYPGQKLYKSGSSAGTSNCFYDENKNFISTVRLVGGVISVPTTNSISYMRTNGPLTDLDSIQITSGDTQSTYEAYIEPKIFIKNDNNIYEEFTKKQEENYSKQERIIGTWIDGKPLYRKVFAGTKESGKNKTINISDLNVDYIRYYGNITTNIGQSDGEYEFPLNYYETSSAYIRTNFHRKYSNITIVSTNGTYFNGNFKLVIEYTKTTD